MDEYFNKESDEKLRHRVLITLITLIVLNLTIISSCTHTRPRASHSNSLEENLFHPTFPTAVVKRGTLVVTKEFLAHTEAKHSMILKAPVSAMIQQIAIDIGDEVQKGQTLVEFDSVNARWRLKKLKEQLAKDGSDKKQSGKLRLEIGKTEDSLKDYIVRSPIKGRVTRVYTSLGSVLEKGLPLIELRKNNELTLTFECDEKTFPHLQFGQWCMVLYDNKWFAANIAKKNPKPPMGQLCKILVEIHDELQQKLELDDLVPVKVSIQEHKDVVLVPTSSITKSPDGNHFVFTVEGETIVPHQIELIDSCEGLSAVKNVPLGLKVIKDASLGWKILQMISSKGAQH